MTDPLIEAENKAEVAIRVTQRVLRDEEIRKQQQEDWKIDRLPYWLHPEADYLPEDSGMTKGDNEDHS